MKKILLSLTFLLLFPANIFAQANNKFGIHIVDENDLEKASELVNSNGGEWGYVTIVIREDERNKDRWQEIFNKMRRFKLVPIIRIATTIENNHWRKPKIEEANNWAAFLNNLNWPIKNRYIILFNEPNHAKEWGGEINPKEYSRVVKEYEKALLNHSKDFKILPAALDLAAPNSGDTMEATRYWDMMHEEDNFIFTRFDFWNSHSYPNPGFSGKVSDTGKTSIRGFEWEINFLENFGLDPEIDVFITETGWIKNDQTANNFEYAFNNVWTSERILAITPFILNYNGQPFDEFSWINADKSSTDQFNRIKQIKKTRGEPEQYDDFILDSNTIARKLVSNSEYKFFINLKNTGQVVWDKKDGYALHFSSTLDPKDINVEGIENVEPFQVARIPVFINTGESGFHQITFQLNNNGKQIGNLLQTNFEIIAPPKLLIKVKGWFDFNNKQEDYQLILKDDEREVMNIDNILVVDGSISIPAVYNVIPENEYEIIVSKENHLPKKIKFILNANDNVLNFGRLLPIDFNSDKVFDINDIIFIIFNVPLISFIFYPF